MKKYMITFLCMYFLYSQHTVFSYSALNEQKIESRGHAIKKLIYRQKLAYNTIMAAGTLYVTYRFFGVNFFNTHECTCEKIIREDEGFFAGLASLFYDTFCTKKGWADLIHFYVTGLMLNKCTSVIDNLGHDKTFSWYVRTHAPYKTIVYKIKTNFIELSACDEGTAQELKKRIRFLTSCLVQSGEEICAYIGYKSLDVDEQYKDKFDHLLRYFINCHNDLIERIETELEKDIPSAELVKQAVDYYLSEIHSQRMILMALERSAT